LVPFIKGATLQEYLKVHGGGLTIKECTGIALQIARGMLYLHDSGLHIFGLTSTHIRIEKDTGRAIICHFELPYGLKPQCHNVISDTKLHIWCAPEICRDNLQGSFTEVYAFGIILWEIFSGQKPFRHYEKKNRIDFYQDIIIRGVRPCLDPVSNIPQYLVHLMTQCWDSEHSMRPTARKIVEQLKENEEGETEESGSVSVSYTPLTGFAEVGIAHSPTKRTRTEEGSRSTPTISPEQINACRYHFCTCNVS